MQKHRFSSLVVFSAAVIASLGIVIASANAQGMAAGKAPAPLTGDWTVDPVHTDISFSIGHLGLSQVQGRFDTVSGSIVANTKDLAKSSVNFTIQVASINTNNSMRDSDVKSKNYFDSDTYPTITFQSTKVSKSSAGYVAVGNLTIHGVTRTISLPFQLEGPIVDPWGNSRIGVVTHAVISRLDYGVGGNGTLSDGSFLIGKDATISISLEATATKAS